MKGHDAPGRFKIVICLRVRAAATMNKCDETATVVKSTENKSKHTEVPLSSMTTLVLILQLIPNVYSAYVITVTHVD